MGHHSGSDYTNSDIKCYIIGKGRDKSFGKFTHVWLNQYHLNQKSRSDDGHQGDNKCFDFSHAVVLQNQQEKSIQNS